MSRVAEVTVEVLEPYVGALVANMCVRIGAEAVSGTMERISTGDLTAYLDAVAGVLAPVAPKESVDAWLAEVRKGVLE